MVAFISFVTVLLLFGVLVLIGKANDLSRELDGKELDFTNQSRTNGYLLLAYLILFFAACAYAFKEFYPLLLPKAASVHGLRTDRLFDISMIIILIAFVLTHIALFYFSYRYNESRVEHAYFYPHNNALEITWTLVPFLVLATMIVMGMIEWYKIFNPNARSKKMMVIEVTGKQFNWIIRYPGKDGKFGERIIDKEHITPTNELGVNWDDPKSRDDFMSDKLYLVKGKPVLMKLGAQDVIHSFFLPHFRVKMDCVPGTPTEFYFTPNTTTAEMQQYLSKKKWWQQENPETGEPRWKSFKYELACAELCGKSHFGMQREVVVVTQAEYDAWMNKQTAMYDNIKPATTPENAVDSTGNLNQTNKAQAFLLKR